MDITYLLLLQDFREGVGGFLAPFMDWVTKFALSFLPLAFLLMIYWVFDRRAGRRMLCGMVFGSMMNGFLKLTVCAYRPWIRDARIVPYGDAKVAATGYSFPSGHSTHATYYYGSIGYWLRDKCRILSIGFFLLIFVTMFSRNYLGVHTPQDVIVGFGATALMLVLGCRVEDWSDQDPDKRDRIIIAAGLAVAFVSLCYFYLKPYPRDILPDGKLLVDPAKMMIDSFSGIGYLSSYVICRYFERRGFAFEKETDWKDRFIIGTVALLPLHWWYGHIELFFKMMELPAAGKFVRAAGIVVYAMIIFPNIMKRIRSL